MEGGYILHEFRVPYRRQEGKLVAGVAEILSRVFHRPTDILSLTRITYLSQKLRHIPPRRPLVQDRSHRRRAIHKNAEVQVEHLEKNVLVRTRAVLRREGASNISRKAHATYLPTT